MSSTANSSRQRRRVSSAICAATGAIGSRRSLAAVPRRLAGGVDAVVDLRHEFVEMGAALPSRRRDGEEAVHQHGLAAADVAVDVEAADGGCPLAGEEPAEGAALGGEAALGERSSSWSMRCASASCAGSRSISPAATIAS